MSKVTLEQLIARKAQSEQSKTKVKEIYSEELDGTILAKKLPLEKFFDILDMDRDTSESTFKANCMLIYQSCDIFHNSELIKEFGCKEPYEIVSAVLCENLYDIGKIADEITKLYGDKKTKNNPGEELKN